MAEVRGATDRGPRRASRPQKYWSRRGIAEWLVERLAEDVPTLVGIDHGFSFPLRYFEVHRLEPNWPAFLEDFQRHWPTDEEIYVDFVRDGLPGNGAVRTMGNTRLASPDGGKCRRREIGLPFRRAGIRWRSPPTPGFGSGTV